jgi:hypothetical protein
MGLRETYSGRDLAVRAHGALKTPTRSILPLWDQSGGGALGERGGGVAPKDWARRLLCTCTAVPGTGRTP